MKKIIKNIWLLVCAAVVAVSVPLLLAHNQPIEIAMPHVTQEQLAEKRQEAEQAAKAAQRKQKINRISSCKTDDDCIIVDKDPCGCAVGPKGVAAINVNYISDFETINNTAFATKACPDELSEEKECSPSAHAVCRNRTCRIDY